MTEYFYVVDEDDRVVGRATREECHRNNRLIHRTVCVFVLNAQNELLLQKRSSTKDLYPSRYTGSATGHVDYGEDYKDAAKRELREELGIEAPLQMLCKVKDFSDIEREISALYLCRHNGPFHFNKSEISEVEFMPIEDVKRSLETDEQKFAYGFKIAFTEFLKHASSINYSAAEKPMRQTNF